MGKIDEVYTSLGRIKAPGHRVRKVAIDYKSDLEAGHIASYLSSKGIIFTCSGKQKKFEFPIDQIGKTGSIIDLSVIEYLTLGIESFGGDRNEFKIRIYQPSQK